MESLEQLKIDSEIEENAPIERSKNVLDEETFEKIFDVVVNQKWLRNKNKELRYLVSQCDNNESLDLVFELLGRFTYLDPTEADRCITQITEKIFSDRRITPDNTIFCALHNDHLSDSAPVILQQIRNQIVEEDGWSEGHFFNNIGSMINNYQNQENIILVDEFIGTGYQAKKLIKRFYEKNLKSDENRIILYVIARMENSIGELSNITDEYYSTITMKRGISDYNSTEDARFKILTMKDLEARLMPEHNNQTWKSLGVGASETLYGSKIGTAPANLFPIFWWKWDIENNRRKNLLNRGASNAK